MREQLDEFLLPDRAIVEVGARLVPLIQSSRSKGLKSRRVVLAVESCQSRSAWWIPPIRVQSNLTIAPDEYRIIVAGRTVGTGSIQTERMLAIPPENRNVDLSGAQATEPAFGLPAVWIDPDHQRQAEIQGCTVVDPLSVLVTHLGGSVKAMRPVT